jgi:hypothetical protein
VQGVVEDVPGASRFDVITLWDVIEHMTDPKSAVRHVHDLLSNNGLIAINTVDSGSVPAKLLGKYWHLVVPPEHLEYFSRKSLVRLLEDAGFEVLVAHRITKRFSFAYIFTTLYRYQGLSLWHYLGKFFGRGSMKRFSVPLQTFDNIYVLAKKRA